MPSTLEYLGDLNVYRPLGIREKLDAGQFCKHWIKFDGEPKGKLKTKYVKPDLEAVYKQFAMYGEPDKPINPKLLALGKRVAIDILKYFNVQTVVVAPEEVTVTRTASAGFAQTHTTKGRYVDSGSFEDFLPEFLKGIYRYDLTPLWSAKGKSEYLPAEKVEDKNTRIFIIPNVDIFFMQAMFMQQFNVRMSQNMTNWCAIGTNFSGGGYDDLMQRLKDFAFKVEGDCTKWDKHTKAQTMGMARDVRKTLPVSWSDLAIRYFERHGIEKDALKFFDIIYNDATFCHVVLPDGRVYKVGPGNMPSGFTGTSYDNTIIHIAVFASMIIQAKRQVDKNWYDLDYLIHEVLAQLYADDHINGIGRDLEQICDFEFRRKHYESWGYKLKREDDFVSETVEGHKFLGAKPVFIDGTYYPVYDVEKVKANICQVENQISKEIAYVRALAYFILICASGDPFVKKLIEYMKFLLDKTLYNTFIKGKYALDNDCFHMVSFTVHFTLVPTVEQGLKFWSGNESGLLTLTQDRVKKEDQQFNFLRTLAESRHIELEIQPPKQDKQINQSKQVKMTNQSTKSATNHSALVESFIKYKRVAESPLWPVVLEHKDDMDYTQFEKYLRLDQQQFYYAPTYVYGENGVKIKIEFSVGELPFAQFKSIENMGEFILSCVGYVWYSASDPLTQMAYVEFLNRGDEPETDIQLDEHTHLYKGVVYVNQSKHLKKREKEITKHANKALRTTEELEQKIVRKLAKLNNSPHVARDVDRLSTNLKQISLKQKEDSLIALNPKRVKRAVDTILLPGNPDIIPERFGSEYESNKTVCLSVNEVINVTLPLNSNSKPDNRTTRTDLAMFTFRNLLRHTIWYDNNPNSLGSTYQARYPSPQGMVSTYSCNPYGQNLALMPAYFVHDGSGTYRPHGNRLYCGSIDRADRRFWMDGNGETAFTIGVTQNSGTSQSLNFLVSYFDGRRIQRIQAQPVTVASGATGTFQYSVPSGASGYYDVSVNSGGTATLVSWTLTYFWITAAGPTFCHRPAPGLDGNEGRIGSWRELGNSMMFSNTTPELTKAGACYAVQSPGTQYWLDWLGSEGSRITSAKNSVRIDQNKTNDGIYFWLKPTGTKDFEMQSDFEANKEMGIFNSFYDLQNPGEYGIIYYQNNTTGSQQMGVMTFNSAFEYSTSGMWESTKMSLSTSRDWEAAMMACKQVKQVTENPFHEFLKRAALLILAKGAPMLGNFIGKTASSALNG